MRLGIASGDRINPKRAHDGKEHWGGAGWARLAQYIPYFEQNGITVVVGTLVWNRGRFVMDITDGDKDFQEVDVIYVQRLMHEGLAGHIQQAHAAGQVVLNDLDDWYWGLSPSNQAFTSSHPKTNPTENINYYRQVLNASKLVTVSTQYLADRISAFVRCPIEITPNYVDVNKFSPVEQRDTDQPVVGWVGSTGHRSGDLEILKGIIGPMVSRHEISFLHGGHHDSFPHISTALSMAEEQVKTIPGTDPHNYPSLLAMEIGVAPLRDTPFNHAKSDIKLLEYSAAGIPWVGSSLSAYSALQKEWGIGRLASKPKEWAKHLSQLRNYETRVSEATQLRSLAESRDIAIGAKQIVDLVKSMAQ